jgi:hypothetical protein
MDYKNQGVSFSKVLNVVDIFNAKFECEHFADGEARVFVVEKRGSI